MAEEPTVEAETEAEVEAPTSVAEVTDSISDTVFDIWANFIDHTPYIAGSILIVFLTWLVTKLLASLGGKLFGRSRMRRSLQDLVLRLITIGVWVFGLLLAAMILFPGLTPAKALGGLGLVSVAVGFAFKDIFENFFAGILLLWKYPFENGDFISCEGVEGKIERIEIRMTVIRQVSGELVVVPNSFLFKNPVDVLTDLPRRRVTIMAGVAYGEDVAESVEVIQNAVEACETVNKEQGVEIFPQGFGASSIDIEVTWWTDPTPLDVRRSRGEVVTAVKKALDDAGIEIPFPYRTLTFKESLPLVRGEREAETGSE